MRRKGARRCGAADKVSNLPVDVDNTSSASCQRIGRLQAMFDEERDRGTHAQRDDDPSGFTEVRTATFAKGIPAHKVFQLTA